METYLIGYGTLLNRGSLGTSIGQSSARGKSLMSVVVRDYRRLFNLRPTHYETSHRLNSEPIENAAMNIERAPGLHFNGLAFRVKSEELERLDERERYYERQLVPMFSFETGKHVGEGHVYVSALDAPWIERDVAKLMPLWRDVVWAREGAYKISDQFGRDFDATTYLADGETFVFDRYGDLLQDVSDVAMPE